MKVEEKRHKRELEYQLKVLEMENQRREKEREHKLKLFKLLLEQKPSSNQSFTSMLPLSMATSTPQSFQQSFQYGWGEQGHNLAQPMACGLSNNLSPNPNAEYTSL